MEEYSPHSSFLNFLYAGEIPLSGSDFAGENLRRLVAMTRDPDHVNRDWAVFFLSFTDIDTEDVRRALLLAALDDDECVRAEATCGLARRSVDIALPFVRQALSAKTVLAPIFEAAAILAHPSLCETLRTWVALSGDNYINGLAAEALSACESGVTRHL